MCEVPSATEGHSEQSIIGDKGDLVLVQHEGLLVLRG